MNFVQTKPTFPMLVLTSAILFGSVISEARSDPLSDAAGQYRIEPSSRIAFSVGKVGGGGI